MEPTLVRPYMRYWRIAPHPRLRPGIVCYFVALPAADGTGPAHEPELLLPDGYSEIVFSYQSAFERWPVGEPARRATMRTSYLIGGRSHSVLTRNVGSLTVIGVKLAPSALRRLIATPLDELRDTTLALRDLNQGALLDLEDALANARSVEQIASLLDTFFLARMSIFEPGDRTVAALAAQIRASQGSVPIVRWIREHGFDVRHLERRFCAWTGMTPKRFARIVRFKHAYHRLLSGEAARGALGRHLDAYYDQSHFHRDFKFFLGVSPTARLRRQMAQGIDISEHLMQLELAQTASSAH